MTTCRARLWRSVVPALLMLSTVAMAEAGAQAQAASITVDDVLTLPNQSVRIEARVGEGTVGGGSALGGIALRLRVDGAAVATAKTDDGGRASFDFTPKMRGNHPMVVEQGESSGSDAGTTAKATLFVWERRRPILLVEVASLVEAGGGAPMFYRPSHRPMRPRNSPACRSTITIWCISRAGNSPRRIPGPGWKPTSFPPAWS